MIVVYLGPNCDNIMLEGQVDSTKRVNILYDDVERYYHVIAKLTVPCLKGTCVKGATNHVQALSGTPETRRVGTVWPAPSANSLKF